MEVVLWMKETLSAKQMEDVRQNPATTFVKRQGKKQEEEVTCVCCDYLYKEQRKADLTAVSERLQTDNPWRIP